MKDAMQNAEELFVGGLNCAQSVLGAFLPEGDPRRADLLRLACGFGAGIGRRQELCGAVSGAIMALGLSKGSASADEAARKDDTYRLTREMMERFEKRAGALGCRELLGCDLASEEGHARYLSENLRLTVCVPCVRLAAELAREHS